jgi:stage II sporulation protein D
MKLKIQAKKAARIAAFLLIFTMLAALFPGMKVSSTFDDYTQWIVRAGINSLNYYTPGYTAQNYANFKIAKNPSGNYTGTSFKLGYYNNQTSGGEPTDRSFVCLYTLPSQKAVTVIRSYNFDVSNRVYVSDGANGSNIIGAYRIELELEDYQTQQTLDNAVASVNSLISGTGYTAYPSYTIRGLSVRIGHFTSGTSAESALQTIKNRLSGTYPTAKYYVVGKGTNAYTVYKTGTTTIYFELDGATRQLGILPYGGAVVDKIGCVTETWHNNNKYYGGFDFVQNSATNFTVVSVVNLVQYVMGVTPYELYPSWPDETLKAHAVCAATFAVRSLNKHSTYGFDVCSGQNCQVYRGTTSLTDKIKNCVLAVAGMIITYDGQPISAVYHSSNGGSTESSEYVWGGYVPYLRAVEDNFETPYLTKGNYGIWTRGPYTGDELKAKLNAKGYTIGKVIDVYAAELTPAGNVYKLAFTDGTNTVTLTGESMRTVLGTDVLLSQHFNIIYDNAKVFYVNDGQTILNPSSAYVINGKGEKSRLPVTARTALTANGLETVVGAGDGEVTFTFDGRGWGHSVGVGQWGAYGMGIQGYTFEQIIKYYYTGVQIKGLDY